MASLQQLNAFYFTFIYFFLFLKKETFKTNLCILIILGGLNWSYLSDAVVSFIIKVDPREGEPQL